MERDELKINLPLDKRFATSVRLFTGGVCALANFTIDDSEDFKVCVTECMLILMRAHYCCADLLYKVGEKRIEFVAHGCECEKCMKQVTNDGESLSFALINELVTEVSFKKNEKDAISSITLIFER